MSVTSSTARQKYTLTSVGQTLTVPFVFLSASDLVLYSNDTTAAGLSVTAYMNLQRLPLPALTFAPAAWDNGYVTSYSPDAAELRPAKVVAQYRLAGDTLYLYCKGKACLTKTLP